MKKIILLIIAVFLFIACNPDTIGDIEKNQRIELIGAGVNFSTGESIMIFNVDGKYGAVEGTFQLYSIMDLIQGEDMYFRAGDLDPNARFIKWASSMADMEKWGDTKGYYIQY